MPTSPNTAEAPGRSLPVPVAVIVAALRSLRAAEEGHAAGGDTTGNKEEARKNGEGAPSPLQQKALLPYTPAVFGSTSNAYIEAEVEAKQGYLYNGKLVDVDADYNITLREATVRRERACDVVRAARRHQRTTLLTQLGSLAPRELLEAEADMDSERVGSATRPRYVGSVLIRSSNLLMVRFPQPSIPTAAEGREKGVTDPRDLRTAYQRAAVAVKKAMQSARNKNREARRKRLAAAQRKKDGN